MSGSSPSPVRDDPSPVRDDPIASRDQGLALVLSALGSVTREFNARGNYPFKSRSLSRSQLDILFVLSEADDTDDTDEADDTDDAGVGAGVGVGGLAAALGVTSGAVTQLIDTLRSAGWVTSEVNPADRRARIIRLTDAAARELAAFQRDYVSSLAPRFDSLTAAEIAELGRLLRKVRSAAPATTSRTGI